jgi:hypothetical protein
MKQVIREVEQTNEATLNTIETCDLSEVKRLSYADRDDFLEQQS